MWWRWNAFNHQICGNWKDFITNNVAIEKKFGHRTFLDLGHLIDDGLISTIDLVMEFGLPSNKM